jgi:REP element-mobilizing transposase RayT
MSFYRRHLPHWHPAGKALFVSWRVHAIIAHEQFLSRAEVAQIVVNALHHSDRALRLYDLHAFVLMGNHVHILIHPLTDFEATMRRVKSFTALRANSYWDVPARRSGKTSHSITGFATIWNLPRLWSTFITIQ